MSTRPTAVAPDEATQRSSLDWGALAGFAFVPLMVAAFLLAPNLDTSAAAAPAKILAYYAQSNEIRGWLSLGTGTLAAFSFAWFLARLKVGLDTVDRTGRAGNLAFGGGLVFTTVLLLQLVLGNAVGVTVGFSESYLLDPSVAILLGNVSYFLLSVAMVGIAVLLAATAATARRTHFLPAWLTWFAIVLTPLSLAAVELFLLPLLLFLVWMLGVSTVLIRTRNEL